MSFDLHVDVRVLLPLGGLVYACSDTDLGEVLFHHLIFDDKVNRDLSSKIYRVSLRGFY